MPTALGPILWSKLLLVSLPLPHIAIQGALTLQLSVQVSPQHAMLQRKTAVNGGGGIGRPGRPHPIMGVVWWGSWQQQLCQGDAG